MASACSSFHRVSLTWETGPIAYVTSQHVHTLRNIQLQTSDKVYTGTLYSDLNGKKIDFHFLSTKNSLILSCEEIARITLSVNTTVVLSVNNGKNSTSIISTPIIIDQLPPSLEEEQNLEIQLSSESIDNKFSVHARFHIESTPSHDDPASKRLKSVPMSIQDLCWELLTKEDIAFYECELLQPGELTLLQVSTNCFAMVMRMPHFKQHAGQLCQTTNPNLSTCVVYQVLEQLKEIGFSHRQDLDMALCPSSSATAGFLCGSFDWRPLSTTDLECPSLENLQPGEFATIQSDQDCYEIIMRMPMDVLVNPGTLCQSFIYSQISATKLESMIPILISVQLVHRKDLDQGLQIPLSSASLEICLRYNLPLAEEDPVFESCSTLRPGEFAITLVSPDCYNIIVRIPNNAQQFAGMLCQNNEPPLSAETLPLALKDLMQARLICRHDLYVDINYCDHTEPSLLDLAWAPLPKDYPGFNKYKQLSKKAFTVVQVIADRCEIIIHMPDQCPQLAGKVCKTTKQLSATLAGKYVKLLRDKNYTYYLDT